MNFRKENVELISIFGRSEISSPTYSQEERLLDTCNYTFRSNIDFAPDSKASEQVRFENDINYSKFETSSRYGTAEQIHEICVHCEKKKCKCGGCPQTDIYEWVANSGFPLLCQRCICKEVDANIENLNETGKSLDELVRAQKLRGKFLRERTVEDYEKGEFSIITEEGKRVRRERERRRGSKQ